MALRFEVVERECRRFRLQRRRGRLDRVRDARVQLAPAAERKPFVGGFTHERVAEAHPAGGVAVDEPVQPLPERVVELRLPSSAAASRPGSKLAPSTDA